MPAAPKSPQSVTPTSTSAKRAGAPKAKGAVRAKSGCYTCRIRRKKCDEQPNDQGHCSTCVRLRLECLGFGAKRPDWLRENRNVLQLRDKIKNFLASQGMIKGHSGSGTRSSDQPNILRLTLNDEASPYHSGSSSSPPSRPQTLANEDPYVQHNTRHHPTSHTRGPASGWPHHPIDQTYRHPNGYSANSEYHRSSTSPQSIDGGYPHQLTSSPSLVPVQPLQNGHRHNRHPHRHQPYGRTVCARDGYNQRQNHAVVLQHHLPDWTPAKSSGISPSYNWQMTDFANIVSPNEWFGQEQQQQCNTSNAAFLVDQGGYAGGINLPTTEPLDARGDILPINSFFANIPASLPASLRLDDVINFLEQYEKEVVTVQYLLGTKSIQKYIVNTIRAETGLTSEQQAAALLSRVHFLRTGRPEMEMVLQNPDVKFELLGIERALNDHRGELKPEDAMAALHLVSVILFDGGYNGCWSQYLETAASFVKTKMCGLHRNRNGMEELRKLGDKEAFIVKTSIWFDVLASVTTGRDPSLLNIIRILFKPGQSGLSELSNAAATVSSCLDSESTSGYTELADEKTSMLTPMGCENKVVWALAEISALAYWKKERQDLGRLSNKDLVLKALDIEKELEIKTYHPRKLLKDFGNDVVAYSRYLAANIFRASAMLYLHTVVSGGLPQVPQIQLAVEEVMRWIRCIPHKPTKKDDQEIHKSVIRSTVFAFYIAGALTDVEKHRKLIGEYLYQEAGNVVGNVRVTADLLKEIWLERRVGQASKEIRWREMLGRSTGSILLV